MALERAGLPLPSGDRIDAWRDTETFLFTILSALTGVGPDGALHDAKVSADGLLLVDASGSAGAFDYAAGVGVGTVVVPAGARITKVSVLAGAANATVQINGGDVITVPAGGGFDEGPLGRFVGGTDIDIAIGGDVASFYVSWVV